MSINPFKLDFNSDQLQKAKNTTNRIMPKNSQGSEPLVKLYLDADILISSLIEKSKTILNDKIEMAQEYVSRIFSYLKHKDKTKNEKRYADYPKLLDNIKLEKINYLNSFVKTSYETISNKTFISSTFTLDSQHHPFSRGFINQKFLNVYNENENNLNFKQFAEWNILNGYNILSNFNRAFYKNRVFRDGKLTSENRSSFIAFEPHKDLTCHLHKGEFINSNNFIEYMNTLFNSVTKNEDINRTELAILWDMKDILLENFELKKIGKNLYKYNDKIQIRILKNYSKNNNSDEDTIKTIINYMSKYMTKDESSKEDGYNYNAYAYLLADLKDKYETKADGTKYKKVRLQRYSRLLVSKQIFKTIMRDSELRKEFKVEEKQHNTYAYVTKYIKEHDIKIYKAYIEDSKSLDNYLSHHIFRFKDKIITVSSIDKNFYIHDQNSKYIIRINKFTKEELNSKKIIELKEVKIKAGYETIFNESATENIEKNIMLKNKTIKQIEYILSGANSSSKTADEIFEESYISELEDSYSDLVDSQIIETEYNPN